MARRLVEIDAEVIELRGEPDAWHMIVCFVVLALREFLTGRKTYADALELLQVAGSCAGTGELPAGANIAGTKFLAWGRGRVLDLSLEERELAILATLRLIASEFADLEPRPISAVCPPGVPARPTSTAAPPLSPLKMKPN